MCAFFMQVPVVVFNTRFAIRAYAYNRFVELYICRKAVRYSMDLSDTTNQYHIVLRIILKSSCATYQRSLAKEHMFCL